MAIEPYALDTYRDRDELRAEILRLRRDAERRYTEMDLLVAALNEHVSDLRAERDRLLSDLERTRQELQEVRQETEFLRADWFVRGAKGPHSASE
ncbi:MAG: hypothetical protein U5Q44_12575 [Dehalococcoidia bacterium]|nr:hypothetical protein [Dehalococcoidia bacterium]